MERVQVEIFGNIYSIKGSADAAHIKGLASFVDARMSEVQKATGTGDPLRVAILTALNLADELHRLKEEHKGLEESTARGLKRLLDLTEHSTNT